MMIKRFITFVLATMLLALMVGNFGCNHEEDKNLPHDSSLTHKGPPAGGPGAKGVQPPPP